MGGGIAMRAKHLLFAMFVVALLSFGSQSVPAQAVTAGSKCTSLGAQQKTGSKTFVCTKSGSKKIWVLKKVAAPKLPQTPSPFPLPSPVSHNWTGPCDFDPFVPQEWKSVQAYLKSFNYCDAPYTLEAASLGAETPTIPLTGSEGLTNLSTCKIQDQRTRFSPIAFSSTRQDKHPGPNTRFQIVPVQTLDAPGTGSTPVQDYGHYFKYLETLLEYMSDGDTNVTFSVPDHYAKLNVNIRDAGIGVHGQPTPSGKTFFQSAISAVDPEVDFSSVDRVIVVIPGQSDPSFLGVQPYVSGATSEGNVVGMSLQPISSSTKLGERQYLLAHPMSILHELFHSGVGLDDHSGNQKWLIGPDLGMANWGLMSTMKTDLSGWEKWLKGFMLDSQIRCVNLSETTNHWIIPGGVKSTKQKLLVIPISSSKVVVIESVRAKGINYKLAKQSEGALVYVVDASEIRHAYGISLILPEGRVMEVESQTVKFIGASAPLKLGESVSVEGVRIQVIEAGVFGDVIQVQKQ